MINSHSPVVSISNVYPDCPNKPDMLGQGVKISGYVNPGEAGYINVTTEFETNDGIDGSSQAGEYIGWSNNPLEKFFFNFYMKVRGKDMSDRPVKFKLWFHPLSGKPDRLLYEKTQTTWVQSGMWGEFFRGNKNKSP